MYKKILGLKQLEKMGFPYPPYQVIDIAGDKPADVEGYVLRKIRHVGIPFVKGDRIGVTIRVSIAGDLDKLTKHGGLHVISEKEVVKRVLEKYKQYKPYGKILVQHTVDARCSGVILKDNRRVIAEAIFGDAPPLLEGEVTDYEKWAFLLASGIWTKERAYKHHNTQVAVLGPEDIDNIGGYVKTLGNSSVYLEWSISKSGKLYFYEYCELKSGTLI